MTSEPAPRQVRRTRRGVEAVEAAIDAFELAERIDAPDGSVRADGDVDLAWVRDRIASARRAAAADVISADEGLNWLAATVSRELDLDDGDEEAAGPAQD